MTNDRLNISIAPKSDFGAYCFGGALCCIGDVIRPSGLLSRVRDSIPPEVQLHGLPPVPRGLREGGLVVHLARREVRGVVSPAPPRVTESA